MEQTPCTPLIHWLSEQANAIATIEEKAHVALQKENNPTAYRELMVGKATLLAKLSLNSRPYTKNLPETLATSVNATLMSFSQNAAQALQLDSVFYMSALLYPDDHKEGEPNNLQKFIASLKD